MPEKPSGRPDLLPLVEPLRGIDKLGDFFAKTHQTAAEQALITIKGSPLSYPTLKNVVINKNYGKLEGSDLKLAIDASRVRERIKRNLIREAVKGENQLHLTDTEEAVVLASCDLGEHFDDLFIAWRKKIETEKKEVDKQRISNHLPEKPKYLYYITEEQPDGELKDIPYATAFKEPVDKITTRMKALVEELKGIDDTDPQGLIAFYKSFSKALSEPDISKHEEAFKELDRKQRAINGKMRPVHLIESQEDYLGRRVGPDYMLHFDDDRERAQRINQRINDKKHVFINALNAIAPSENLVGAGGLSVGFGAGMRLHFDPSAQVIPNREDVRTEVGVGFEISPEQIDRGRTNQDKLIAHIFEHGERLTTEREQLIDMRTIFTAYHEIGHNAFRTATTMEDLDDNFDKLEELKSDTVAAATIPAYIEDPAEQDAMLTTLLGASLLYAGFGKPDRLNYYYSGLNTLRTMIKSGLVQEEDGQLKFDLTDDKKELFFANATEVVKDIANVYEPPFGTTKQDHINTTYYAEPKDAAEGVEEETILKAVINKLATFQG